jgi:hypothetical protein
MPAPFSGGCRCGAVRYTCSVAPIAVLHCHCRDCQYASGGAFATVVLVPGAALRIEQGELREFAVRGESGGTVSRRFCSICGTPVLSGIDGGMLALKAGTLDDPSWLAPALEIWTDSAQPWAPRAAGLAQRPRNP